MTTQRPRVPTCKQMTTQRQRASTCKQRQHVPTCKQLKQMSRHLKQMSIQNKCEYNLKRNVYSSL